MTTNQWSDVDGMMPPPPPQANAHEAQLDRQMIRHLLNKYSSNELAQLVQEESHSPTMHTDAASVLTSSTFSSVKSEDAPSVFDASSIRSISNTSSTRSSIISNVSARTAKLLGRKSQSSAASTHSNTSEVDESSWDAEDEATNHSSEHVASASGAAKQKGTFMCGFCKEEEIQKTCTRKNDLKRHIEDFHNMNAQWFCRHRGCQMVFDWQTAYKTHLKQSHGGSRMSLDEAKVNLCPQTVFACGFENCVQVFEAPSDDDAVATFKEYVGHVVKHFDEGSNSGEWTYSARIRNLLRQSSVQRAWNSTAIPESDRSRLHWLPQSSGILRKRLETRHITDLQLLIQYVITLGSNPNGIQKYREDFVTPVKNECHLNIPGHKINPQPPMPMAQPGAPEPDPFQFKIPRASNTAPNPSLAMYMASQRRMYPPRPPVRSGRSARPPMRTLTSTSQSHAPSPLGPQQYNYNAAPQAQMYDPHQQQGQAQYQHQYQQAPQPQQQSPHGQPQQQHQQFSMMPQVNGGIVADDIRSFHSMTGGSSEPDMDMADAQMMDSSSFMSGASDFSSQFGSDGLQSPHSANQVGNMPVSSAMEQQSQHAYGGYNGTHVS